MRLTAHYRVVPTHGADKAALLKSLAELKVPVNRITRSTASHTLEATTDSVTSYLWIAEVDAMNDRYTMPTAQSVQEHIGTNGVVTEAAVFKDVE